MYVSALIEHLDPDTQNEVRILAESERRALLENSMFQLNPYETLVLPILSVFYPRLIARELVTVTPIDKPEVIKAVLKPKFTKWNSSGKYDAPSMTDISAGPTIDISSGGLAAVPGEHQHRTRVFRGRAVHGKRSRTMGPGDGSDQAVSVLDHR